jgi:hemolysin type calcium-binding protein/calcineurin-like phosphoesterase family protein
MAVVLAAVLAGALLGPAGAAGPACTIQGTPGADRLFGTPARDVICGGDGRDVIGGAAGDDILRGGRGADRILAGSGDDRVFGQRGSDRIWGEAGHDHLSGGGANDRLYAHDGWRDTLVGGPGRDHALGDRQDVRRAVESFSVPVPESPTIEAGPPAGRVTNSRDATLEFSAASPVRFECRLDSRPWTACGAGRRGTATYEGLGDGEHVFSVRAVDGAGSASSPATRSWRIDATAPTAHITSAPRDGTSRTATFRYSSSEPGRFECNLDASGFRPCGTGTSGSKTYSSLSLGAHEFEVRAVDAVGNVGTPDSHRWTILSPPSPSDPVIAAAGDIACDPAHPNFNGGNGQNGNCRQLATSNLLVGKGYEAVLPLGDNQYYCGSYAAWLASYDPSWGRVKNVTHPVVGNHEYLTHPGTLPSTGCDATNAGASGYFRYFGTAAADPNKGYYSYDVGSWHLIALNSNCGDAGGCGSSSPQTRWLRADLAAHRTRCTLAYWHVPLYSSGGRAESKTSTFWQALYNTNADVVLTGHDHTYERFAPQNAQAGLDPARGIREFVVGTGGANHTSFVTTAAHSEVRNSTTYGVLELKLHAGNYDWKFIPEPGRSFSDSGTNACH